MVSRSSHAPAETSPSPTNVCPDWCVIRHGVFLGDEDWLHMGPSMILPGGVSARICLSVDPATSISDGPHIVTDDGEWTAAQARELGLSLIALAESLETLATAGLGD